MPHPDPNGAIRLTRVIAANPPELDLEPVRCPRCPSCGRRMRWIQGRPREATCDYRECTRRLLVTAVHTPGQWVIVVAD